MSNFCEVMMKQELLVDKDMNLSILVINLLKGVVYRIDDQRLWASLLNLQTRVRDYMSVIGLKLVLDEAEGYAFLCNKLNDAEHEDATLPPLIASRPLSFQVSLLLALLRKKLAEFDTICGDERLVLSLDEIVDLMRVFLPETNNEARLIDQIEANINKIIDLGFLHRLKSISGSVDFEVKRILKAFVTAEWLIDFDKQLSEYQAKLAIAKC